MTYAAVDEYLIMLFPLFGTTNNVTINILSHIFMYASFRMNFTSELLGKRVCLFLNSTHMLPE